jgi:hypothetical protein
MMKFQNEYSPILPILYPILTYFVVWLTAGDPNPSLNNRVSTYCGVIAVR